MGRTVEDYFFRTDESVITAGSFTRKTEYVVFPVAGGPGTSVSSIGELADYAIKGLIGWGNDVNSRLYVDTYILYNACGALSKEGKGRENIETTKLIVPKLDISRDEVTAYGATSHYDELYILRDLIATKLSSMKKKD